MATKKEILKNLGQFSPEEIADAVRAGTVSLYELGKETEGAFTPLLRQKVKQILAEPAKEESQAALKATLSNSKDVPMSSQVEKHPSAASMAINPSPAPIVTAPVLSTSSTDMSATTSSAMQTPEEVQEEPAKPGMFSRPFSFEGRIRRLEYGISIIIFYAFAFLCGMLAAAVTGGADNTAQMVAYIFLIPGYWFIWAQGAKRCHDRNNSGWYQIIPFYVLWMLFAPGDEEENDYGVSPK